MRRTSINNKLETSNIIAGLGMSTFYWCHDQDCYEMYHFKTVLTAESCYKLILTLLLHHKKKPSNAKQDYILVYLDDIVILSKKKNSK